MKKVLKYILTFAVMATGLALFSKQTMAADVNYHTYKYHTKETSMATTYYVTPAQVEVSGGEYLVTMTIRTKKSLSPWPVKVISIDGQSPMNVTKTRHGSDYDYRYAFRSSNLNRMISSQIKIEVPNIYKATHMVSFKFDQTALPKLTTSANSSKSQTKTAKKVVTPVKQSSTKKQTSQAASPNDKQLEAIMAQAKKQSKDVKKRQMVLAEAQAKQNLKNRQANEKNQKMFYYLILGGILNLIILIVAAVFFVFGIKPAGSRGKHEEA